MISKQKISKWGCDFCSWNDSKIIILALLLKMYSALDSPKDTWSHKQKVANSVGLECRVPRWFFFSKFSEDADSSTRNMVPSQNISWTCVVGVHRHCAALSSPAEWAHTHSMHHPHPPLGDRTCTQISTNPNSKAESPNGFYRRDFCISMGKGVLVQSSGKEIKTITALEAH